MADAIRSGALPALGGIADLKNEQLCSMLRTLDAEIRAASNHIAEAGVRVHEQSHWIAFGVRADQIDDLSRQAAEGFHSYFRIRPYGCGLRRHFLSTTDESSGIRRHDLLPGFLMKVSRQAHHSNPCRVPAASQPGYVYPRIETVDQLRVRRVDRHRWRRCRLRSRPMSFRMPA